MSYSEPIINQIIVFLRSVGIGTVIGAVYLLLTLVRKLFLDRKWICFTCDIIFWVISFYISFIFMIVYNKGLVRITLMMGELAGALAFYFAFGRAASGFAEKRLEPLKKILDERLKKGRKKPKFSTLRKALLKKYGHKIKLRKKT